MRLRPYAKVLLMVTIATLLTTTAGAQTTSKTGPKYDLKNEVKIKGVIDDVREVAGPPGGTQLAVKTDTQTVLVYVGPTAFLKEIDATFNKGEQAEILGCKAPDASTGEILAREITVGQNTTTLRDDKGVPIWSGWKPGGK